MAWLDHPDLAITKFDKFFLIFNLVLQVLYFVTTQLA